MDVCSLWSVAEQSQSRRESSVWLLEKTLLDSGEELPIHAFPQLTNYALTKKAS